MKCAKCQSENREGAKFCQGCGSKLELSCPSCGYPFKPGARFCDECGKGLREPAEAQPIDYSTPRSYTPKFLAEKILTYRSAVEGERKLVTVFFADVANFTSLSEKLDPEEAHQIMDGCFGILMDAIHKYEGTINQFTGDGVMALFGAPLAHEDHAQRACYAALSVQSSLREYGDRIKKERGVDFKMRIGLNSGPVVVGSIGDDLRMDYTAIGDTINLASRIESTAKPGSILVSGLTHKLVRDYFEFESLGKVQVKGKEEPQEAYKLIRPGKVKTRIEAAAVAGITKFVGRRREMETLQEALEKTRSGAGQAVGIVGEAGVGKSRIIFEMRKMFPKEEYSYLEGRCVHYGGSVAYLPILDMLRSYFESKEGEHEVLIKKKMKEKISHLDETLKSVLPPFQELLSLETDDESYLKLEPKQKREKIFEAIRNLFIRESQNKPLILVFEDLQWIDKTSEEFLDYFMGWLANTPILLILLYRPEYTHRWGSRSYYSNVRVDQLSRETSAQLVQTILSEGAIVPELRELILGKTAGNPLFIEELTHTLLENGSIQRKGNQYVLRNRLTDIQVPDTIQGIIAARIDRLDESLKRIMQVASVIGREFAFRILQSIVEMKEELKSHLVNLQGLEFIYEKRLFPELEYIFKHALTQEVAYNSLLLKRRRETHGRIGGAIEEIYSDRLEEFYEMLAYHYSNSDNLEKAVQYLKLCGNKTMRTYSPIEAFRFYRDAIGILKQMRETVQNKKEQIEVILSMAHSMRLLAYPEDSFKLLQEGETLCKEVKDKKSLAILDSHLGYFYSAKGDAALGMKYQQDAFEEAERLQDIQLTARIGAMLTFSMDVAGEYRKVVHITPRILASLEKTQGQGELFGMPVDLRSYLYANYGHGLGYVGEFAKGEKACNKALSLAQEADNVYSIAIAEFLYGCLFSPKGDGENSAKHMETSIGYLEKLKAVFFLPLAWCLIGEGYRLMGDHGKALGFAEKGLKMKMNIGAPGWLCLHHWGLSLIHFDLGNLNEARVHAEQALNLAQTNREKYFEGESWLQLGRTLGKMEESQIDEAEAHIQRGMKMLADLETRPAYAVGCLNLGELYVDAGKNEKALENLRRAEGMFSRMGMDYWLVRARKSLASL
jgi:class 3 adenylate cyclase/tetratricopeptide (TPR) repeat protein